jgi:hypothetical protein
MRMESTLDQAVATLSGASAEVLRLVAELDESGTWKTDGATSVSGWLAARYALTSGTGREWLRVARALRRLPRIAEAFAAGRLSWDQLKFLTRFATAETDLEWAVEAPRWSPAALYREAERYRKISDREAADARSVRSVSMWWDDEARLLYLQGTLPAEQGVTVQAALEARAREIVLADAPFYPGEARMADALVELVTGGADDAAAVVVVHADAGVLAGSVPASGPVLAETESGMRLSSHEVRRIACDAKVEWVLESEGHPVGIGRRSRHIPPRVLRLLRHRDLGMCRCPGCERRRWLKAHHLVHWADGGPTDLDNLVLLCHAHHTLLHEGGWSTSGHPARELRFHDPGGRLVERAGPRLARLSA